MVVHIKDTREEQAKREIGVTDVSRGVAWMLTIAYLTITFGVAAVEYGRAVVVRQRGEKPETARFHAAWNELGPALAAAWRDADSTLDRALGPNTELMKRINTYQTELDDRSWIVQATKAPIQALMCRLGVGNEKAVIGREDWLFFEPDIAHVTGPGFLEPRQLLKRSRANHAPQPDPVRGIVHFRDQLARRGVELVVVPTPVKPTVHPEKLSARAPAGTPVVNASYATFIERLREAGVRVWDPTALLTGADGAETYLKTDTHWRPEVMQRVAEELARHLVSEGLVTGRGSTAYTRQAETVEYYGDIRVMLGLPEGVARFPMETVKIERVLEPDGAPWRSRSGGEVLLLGDSFTNIYAMKVMNWGDAAGLAEQLSCAMAMPVERISENDAGSFVTREKLAVDLARGEDRLAGKKVVVWQFADRELSQGDWKLIALPEGSDIRTRTTPALEGAVEVTGVVAAVSEAPRRDATYADFIMKFHVTKLKRADGEPFGAGDGLVHARAMRNRVILPVAALRPGARVRARIVDWTAVEDLYGALKSGSMDDDMLELEKDYYYAEVIEPD